MFQASLAIGVLAVNFGLHGKIQPFVTPAVQQDAFLKAHDAGDRPSSTDMRKLAGARDMPVMHSQRRLRRNAVAGAIVTASGAIFNGFSELLDFNRLETVLLCSSTAVLLCGMIFASSELDADSPGYTFFTVCVGAVIICSIGMFVWMLVLETRRSCKQRKAKTALPKSARNRRLARVARGLRRFSKFVGGHPEDATTPTIDSVNPLHAAQRTNPLQVSLTPAAPTTTPGGGPGAPSLTLYSSPIRRKSNQLKASVMRMRQAPHGPTAAAVTVTAGTAGTTHVEQLPVKFGAIIGSELAPVDGPGGPKNA